PNQVDVDDRDRLRQYGDRTFTYTDSGDLATQTQGAATVTYDYDAFDGLRRVELPSGVVIDYVIDGARRRIGKKVGGVLVQGWLYQDRLNPIAELDGSGSVTARFVYGTRADAPDAMVKDDATYRIVADHLGSPRLVVVAATRTVAQALRYDALAVL
ncbi:MAG: RHS repeat protein, partial [Acidobacteriota bacterium]